MLYHAYEVATEGAYDMHVSPKEEVRDRLLIQLLEFYESTNTDVETIATGTVEAPDVESALNKIRKGDWEYSQKD